MWDLLGEAFLVFGIQDISIYTHRYIYMYLQVCSRSSSKISDDRATSSVQQRHYVTVITSLQHLLSCPKDDSKRAY